MRCPPARIEQDRLWTTAYACGVKPELGCRDMPTLSGNLEELKVCAVQGCDELALWEPVILLWPAHGKPTEVHLEVPHCPDHKSRATLETLISDQTFQELTDILESKGCLPPIREKTRLVFKEIIERH